MRISWLWKHVFGEHATTVQPFYWIFNNKKLTQEIIRAGESTTHSRRQTSPRTDEDDGTFLSYPYDCILFNDGCLLRGQRLKKTSTVCISYGNVRHVWFSTSSYVKPTQRSSTSTGGVCQSLLLILSHIAGEALRQ